MPAREGETSVHQCLTSSGYGAFAGAVTNALSVPASPEASIGNDEAGRHWREDLDPGALPPTPARSAGQRRVMRASLVHFASRGYGGSNVRDIAATLGVQAGSVYKHFPSKEAILASLVFLGYDHHREITVNAAMSAPSTPEAQLSAFVEAHVRLHCEYSLLSVVVHHEWQNLSPDSLALAELRNDQSTEVLRAILQRGLGTGVFRLPDPELAIVTVTGLGMSAAHWFPYQADRSAADVTGHFAATALQMCGVDA